MNKQDELQRAVQPDGEEMIKKRYHKPVLNQYEDLRTVTLGSSPGAQESGSLGPYKRVGFDPPPPPNPGAPAGSSDADANIFGGS
jgi:hypothetical protein